jgi:hypothetical protein
MERDVHMYFYSTVQALAVGLLYMCTLPDSKQLSQYVHLEKGSSDNNRHAISVNQKRRLLVECSGIKGLVSRAFRRTIDELMVWIQQTDIHLVLLLVPSSQRAEEEATVLRLAEK